VSNVTSYLSRTLCVHPYLALYKTNEMCCSSQNGTVGHVVHTESFLFLSANLIQDAPRHFEIYTILLPLCVLATAVTVMRTYYGRIFGYDLNTHFQPFSFEVCKQINFFIVLLFFLQSIGFCTLC